MVGWPWRKAGFADKLVGYFVTDVGTIHQLVHLWRCEGDDDRRYSRPSRVSDGPFMTFTAKLRPLAMPQEVKLMLEAPRDGFALTANGLQITLG